MNATAVSKTTATPSTDTFTLLVWEQSPDSARLVLIPNDVLDDTDRRLLRAVQGKYVNGNANETETEQLLCLAAALCRETRYLPEDHPVGSRWAQRFLACVQPGEEAEEVSEPIEGKIITAVYKCGLPM